MTANIERLDLIEFASPPKAKKKHPTVLDILLLCFITLLVMMVLSIISSVSNGNREETISQLKQDLSAKQQDIADLGAQPNEHGGTLVEMISSRSAVYPDDFLPTFEGLTVNAVPGAWLTSISVSNPEKNIVFKGLATSTAAIHEFVASLHGVKQFSGKNFGQLDVSQVTGNEAAKYQFILQTEGPSKPTAKKRRG